MAPPLKRKKPSKSGPNESLDWMNQSSPPQPTNGDLMKLMSSLHAKMHENLSTTKGLQTEVESIKNIISTQDKRIGTVERRVEKIDASVHVLETEQEFLQKEINKLNLIFEGIPDSADENEDTLYSRVKVFISEISKDDISFDTAYRLGTFKPNYRRPVKVRFLAMCQRNLIYSKRSILHSPFYINEDLPYTIRRDHAIIRNKKKDALKSGIPAEKVFVDWRHRSIQINDDKFTIQDGKLTRVPSSQEVNNVPLSSSQAYLGLGQSQAKASRSDHTDHQNGNSYGNQPNSIPHSMDYTLEPGQNSSIHSNLSSTSMSQSQGSVPFLEDLTRI